MNTFMHTCTHCGEKDFIDRAVMVACPKCRALPDHPCMDMRGLTPGVKPIVKMHTERQELVKQMMQGRYATVRRLQSVGTG